VLVTNGGLGLFDPQMDSLAVQWNSMGLAIANAAKHKLVGLLSEKLRADDIIVGEVVVLGVVKGARGTRAARRLTQPRLPTSSGTSTPSANPESLPCRDLSKRKFMTRFPVRPEPRF
jgi:hypothetical protein